VNGSGVGTPDPLPGDADTDATQIMSRSPAWRKTEIYLRAVLLIVVSPSDNN